MGVKKLNNTTIPIKIELRNISRRWISSYRGGWFTYTFDIFIDGRKMKHVADEGADGIEDIKIKIKNYIKGCF